ncbi:hypothetical protein AAFF_G00273710 [Aldrovandia affinis]|uniref:Uncharacterized protein n=1 Tax=Aldrovandia affinis TaxID=143900 RepID=A0AAD7SRG6_9TELE|nr:hypothetical protein AAFF_G00273710 [Aldrovandia affinis]
MRGEVKQTDGFACLRTAVLRSLDNYGLRQDSRQMPGRSVLAAQLASSQPYWTEIGKCFLRGGFWEGAGALVVETRVRVPRLKRSASPCNYALAYTQGPYATHTALFKHKRRRAGNVRAPRGVKKGHARPSPRQTLHPTRKSEKNLHVRLRVPTVHSVVSEQTRAPHVRSLLRTPGRGAGGFK